MKANLLIALLLGAAVGCGGNYSNEDIDFQLALPDREDLVVKLPAQSLDTADSAEYYRHTHTATKGLNGIADAFLGLIDYVRLNPPTQRVQGHRVWGPFPADRHPEWSVHMVLDREGDPDRPARFDYSIEVRRTGDPGAWIPIITGGFAPSGGVRRGVGELHFTATAARAAGYPLEGLSALERLDITYRTNGFPISLHIASVAFPGGESSSYDYLEEQDGSASMQFVFPTPGGGVWVSSLEILSQWTGSGAGRADVKVLGGLAVGMKGTDCWGIDTRPVYVHRDWDKAMEKGLESACVFRAP
jgi:hypothetical protein